MRFCGDGRVVDQEMISNGSGTGIHYYVLKVFHVLPTCSVLKEDPRWKPKRVKQTLSHTSVRKMCLRVTIYTYTERVPFTDEYLD